MARFAWLAFVLAAIPALGQPDPAFDNIPFNKWLKGKDTAKIDWSLDVSPPVLNELQRLATSVTANVGPSALAKWSYSGPKVLFLEVRDRQNRRYRTHLPLTLPKGADYAAGWKWTESLCVAPGDYEIAAAIYDAESKDHSLRRTKLHVPELHNDPLPGAWSGLPSLENGGRACYDSRLSLPLRTRSPVQIDVIVNTPVDPDTSIAPRIRVISEIQVLNGSMTAIGLDLVSRKVTTLKVAGPFDEKSLVGPFTRDSRAMVDARTLDIGSDGAEFSVSQIRKRAEAERVLIIVSDRRSLPKSDAPPIPGGPAPGARIFYVRCNPPPNYRVPAYSDGSDPSLAAPRSQAPGLFMPPFPPSSPRPDSLERTLDPLHPRLFDVTTPIEFRRALAEIMSDISQWKGSN